MTPESKIKKDIRDTLRKLGWHYRSIASTQYTRAGLPDAYAIKKGVVLFLELKSEKGKQTDAQANEMFNIVFSSGHYILVRSFQDIIDYCGKNNIIL
jgi:Holliday junction resolvase